MTLDAAALDRGARLAALREATGGLGPDLMVSCSGTPATFAEAVKAVRPGGTVIEAGAFCDASTVGVDPNLVCVKGIAVLGVGGEVLQQYGGPSGGAVKVLVAPNGHPDR